MKKNIVKTICFAAVATLVALPAFAQENTKTLANEIAEYSDCSMTCEDFVDMDACYSYRSDNPCQEKQQVSSFHLYFFDQRDAFGC